MKFLLYGANGYTGKLIAESAKEFGLTPILAGRSVEKIRPLAEQLGYEYRVFDLSETEKLDAALEEVDIVLHAAGPFFKTAKPMLEACLRTKTHYLDITGEIPVFELAASLDAKAKKAGIIIMPGVGFDVVPTDCLALYLKEKLPSATHLKLAFSSSGGGVSHGTAMTMAENLGEGGAVREAGKIKRVPLGHKTMYVPFTDGKKHFVMTIPWGDVATAYRTTGIPNIETYMGIHPASYKYVKLQKYFNWLLKTSFARNYVKKQINKRPAGPSDEQLTTAKSYVYGIVQDINSGQEKAARLTVPNGYQLTKLTSLFILATLLKSKNSIASGYHTPAGAFGADLILSIDNVKREDL